MKGRVEIGFGSKVSRNYSSVDYHILVSQEQLDDEDLSETYARAKSKLKEFFNDIEQDAKNQLLRITKSSAT